MARSVAGCLPIPIPLRVERLMGATLYEFLMRPCMGLHAPCRTPKAHPHLQFTHSHTLQLRLGCKYLSRQLLQCLSHLVQRCPRWPVLLLAALRSGPCMRPLRVVVQSSASAMEEPPEKAHEAAILPKLIDIY